MERKSQASHFPACVLSHLVLVGPTPARPLSGGPNPDLHGPLGHLMAWEMQNLKALKTVKSSVQVGTSRLLQADVAFRLSDGPAGIPPILASRSGEPVQAASLEDTNALLGSHTSPKNRNSRARLLKPSSYRRRWEEGMSKSEGGARGFLCPVPNRTSFADDKGSTYSL